jgi:hypothetical protein
MVTPAPLMEESTTLSRELADFLLELSIAFHKHAIYPDGHPLVGAAVVAVERRLALLFTERNGVSFGVARSQLVIEGVATDETHPVLRELAGRFHRHHLAAVRFTTVPTREVIASFLRTVAADGARLEKPLGLRGAEALEAWPGIALFPLSFSRLELLDGQAAEDAAAVPASRAAELWVGLARAALGDAAQPDGRQAPGGVTDEDGGADPVAVARAIETHARDVAYDQVVVGYLLQMAGELRGAPEAEAAPLRRRISRLVRNLNGDTLTHLLEMGGSSTQRQRFVLDASEGLAVDAVVELVQAAASASEQTISHSMLRMLGKLATHAEVGTDRVRPAADMALREQVRRLVEGWKLEDPNPEGYRTALDAMSRSLPEPAGTDGRVPCEPTRVVCMAIETGCAGRAALDAVDHLANERLAHLLDLLDEAPREGTPGWTAALFRTRVATEGRLRALLAAERVEVALVARLARTLGESAVPALLDALVAASDRDARPLLDLLVTLGPGVGEQCAARLAVGSRTPPRLMLAVLARLAELPAAFSVTPFTAHADPDVRREAFKILLRRPATRELAVCTALADADERLVWSGMTAAMAGCPERAVALLMRRADDHALRPELRALGVRTLGTVREERVRDWLMARVRTRARFTGRVRLAAKSPEMLAAVAALAGGWRDDPTAQAALELARRSHDAEVRAAAALRATGLAGRATPLASDAVAPRPAES